jgi:predicted glycosyltransferase involved in capsule biosynthesis
LTANSKSVFLLNDDIKVAPGIENEFRSIITESVCLINNTWSHFLLNRKITEEIGLFDEGFRGIGNEDQDYEFRMLLKGKKVENVYFKNIKSLIDIPVDYSYGKSIEIANSKYSKVNYDYFLSKWQINEFEQNGFTYSSKFKLWFKPNNSNS